MDMLNANPGAVTLDLRSIVKLKGKAKQVREKLQRKTFHRKTLKNNLALPHSVTQLDAAIDETSFSAAQEEYEA